MDIITQSLLMGSSGAQRDPYFKNTVLLLHGDGTNGAQNNTFIDGSTNNFTVTRNGNTTQGAVSPFGDRWSNYWDGAAELSGFDLGGSLLGSSNFTIEFWVYIDLGSGTSSTVMPIISNIDFYNGVTNGSIAVFWHASRNSIDFALFTGGGNNSSTAPYTTLDAGTNTIMPSKWYHLAYTRSGANLEIFVDGVSKATGTLSSNTNVNYNTRSIYIGRHFANAFSAPSNTRFFRGNISNFRLVVGSVLYTSAFTPSSTPLTAVTNTQRLTCHANRYIDGSSNAFAIGVAGSVAVSRFNPFRLSAPYNASTDGGSGYFDGTGDSLRLPSSSAFSITTSTTPFTIEAWIYPTAVGGVIFSEQFTGGVNSVAIAVTMGNALISTTTGSTIYFGYYTGSTWVAAAGANSNVPLNAWTHVACVFTGSTSKIYYNGADVTATSPTPATTWGITGVSGDEWYVGKRWDNAATECFTGYISNFRFVRGTAVYTAAFTSPTAPLTAVTNTSLLLNFANAGIYDNTTINVLETVGNAQISTTQKKFGTGALYFDGSGDFLTSRNAGAASAFAFGGQDFTIELWIYAISLGTSFKAIYDQRPTSATGAYPTLYVSNGVLYYYTNGQARITGPSLSLNTWYHVAVCRSGSSTRMFVDGVQQGSTYTDSSVYLSGSGRPWIGQFSDPTTLDASLCWNGYIDDLRVTKEARYTADFTPPSAPFLDS